MQYSCCVALALQLQCNSSVVSFSRVARELHAPVKVDAPIKGKAADAAIMMMMMVAKKVTAADLRNMLSSTTVPPC